MAPDPVGADGSRVETATGRAAPDPLGEYIRRTPQRSAKNKTFYLDEAVISAIKAAAKRQKVTESKLVNDILSKILGIS